VFGRATIRLGICPHSSFIFFLFGARVRAVFLPLSPVSTLSFYLLFSFGLLLVFHLFCFFHILRFK